eukprot:s2314_g10.t1
MRSSEGRLLRLTCQCRLSEALCRVCRYGVRINWMLNAAQCQCKHSKDEEEEEEQEKEEEEEEDEQEEAEKRRLNEDCRLLQHLLQPC